MLHDNSAEIYVSPLAVRFATEEMLRNFSEMRKFRTWRRVWIALAEAEKELGLPITDEQIAELRAHQDDVNLKVAAEYERKFRHDVMAHVHAYGDQCPTARPIIHLGATSCEIGDNADIIIMRDALVILRAKLVNLIDRFGAFAVQYRDLPALGWTHFQPAQLTTVGKRACLWIQDFAMDLEEIESRLAGLKLRGIKGTTGTQASFLELLNGNHSKVLRLERLVALKLGFGDCFPVTGQTYPRKLDAQVLNAVTGIGQSAHKFANDLRLLMNLREVEEPFEKDQIGSSAMAYKRNPMRCERITGLARFLLCLQPNAAFTAAEQWLERTLDDSSNRRLSLPEAFLAADATLNIAINVASGLVVRPKMIEQRVARELPFMATEAIIMAGVKAGGDRQELHEKIRQYSVAAATAMSEGAERNDLLDRIAADPLFAAVRKELPRLTDPKRFVGRAPQQVDQFVKSVVAPIRRRYASDLGAKAELKV
jgi:adenylosuccinate lyase